MRKFLKTELGKTLLYVNIICVFLSIIFVWFMPMRLLLFSFLIVNVTVLFVNFIFIPLIKNIEEKI
jgi:uncharacterized membrane-anchored protein YitT (DUF2179 family)